ncbi:MAG: type II toxin-antitoxin system RelE/ParE family toxin [Candidatus Hydrogenedentes bacterium]|nr:type II toxin-antitoxin system RelE/ParE family toxin [Candidatus Hydrogenedentota bacterium]
MYTIFYAAEVANDLGRLRAYERARILETIENQLRYNPSESSRNRKILYGLVVPWDSCEPNWELRIGRYRVFYDVDESASTVCVRAVRFKPPHKTIREIL